MSESSYLEAVQALEGARENIENEMIAAKMAHKADPTPETRAAYEQAVATLQSVRTYERRGRGTSVAGDAFRSEGN